MKTTLASLTLCLVALMATGFPFERKGGSSGGGKEKRVQYAAWDDVNVIAHGLMQLGQGLKEHVDKTKLQMRDISAKLKAFNGTVTELGKESQRLRVEGQALSARVHGLEDREGQVLNITAELREKVEETRQERRVANERMGRLEEKAEETQQERRVANERMGRLEEKAEETQQERRVANERMGKLEETQKERRVVNQRMGRLEEKAEETQQERRVVKQRMNQLEAKVDSVLQGEGVLPDLNAGNAAAGNYSDARIIQWMLEAQNKRIDDLVDRIRLQQEKLDKQNVRIRTLQNQIQLTKERPPFKRSKADGTVLNGSVEQRDSPVGMATNCHELFLRGETASGVYTIQPLNAQPFEVFCEMTAEGGWTVIQNRHDGSLDFDQLWQAYQKGFGSLNGEFWLGLEKIHSVSKDGDYILKIQFSDWRDDSESLRFPFRLGGEESKYSLHIQGTAAVDNLESSLATDAASGLPFSTRDQDNDQKSDINCAKHLSGGWWFSNCGRSNLNGRYFQSPPPKQRHQRKQGVFWKTWRGRYYPLKTTVMMVAPAEIENKS